LKKGKTTLKQLLSSLQELTELLEMSKHPSGYHRENAVRLLGKLGDSAAIPDLIMRINDWVPQVRSAAKESLLSLLVPENAQAFTANLPLIFHLKTCGRENHLEFVSQVVDFLFHPENKKFIKRALLSDQPLVVRIAAKLAIQFYPEDRGDIIRICLLQKDVVVRNIAAVHFQDLPKETLLTILDVAIQDPYMPVRRESFQIYLRINPEKGMLIAQEFLYDRHFSIREIAINKLKQKDFDVRALYVESLDNENTRIRNRKCAILGLAYLRSEEDVPRIIQLTEDGSSGIRKSVLQALYKFHGDKYRSIFVRHLRDDSPGVAKQACNILTKLKVKFQAMELSQEIPLHSNVHTLELTAKAMRASNKWERLIFLLKTLNTTNTSETEMCEFLIAEISEWDSDFNRSSNQPSSEQVFTINTEYAKCAQKLASPGQRSLEFTIRMIN